MGNIAIAFATSTISFSEFVEVKRQKQLENKRVRTLIPTYIARLNRSDETITTINLNGLGVDTNILRLLTAPINRGQTCVTELHLEHNWFGSEGAAVVARVLSHNIHLKIVSLAHNHIGSIGAMAIANALEQNTVLQRLNLGYCEIDDDGVKKLATSLKKNHTLKYLNLEGNFVSSEGVRSLLNCVYDTSGGIQSLFDSNHSLISYHNGQRTIYNPNFPETTVSNRQLVFQLASVLASCNFRYSQPRWTTTTTSSSSSSSSADDTVGSSATEEVVLLPSSSAIILCFFIFASFFFHRRTRDNNSASTSTVPLPTADASHFQNCPVGSTLHIHSLSSSSPRQSRLSSSS
mmetsp:Transcript_12316/g.18285  ORF Transcript_12316/g.18285 Transcript_12316/m.18285 type:complete len:348 (-) Transcript_12316:427-1470(-)